MPITVFLDANILIQMGKPPGDPLFDRVRDLVKAGFISVLTTDHTISEIAKKHIENDYNAIKDVVRPHARVILQKTLGVAVPEINKDAIREILAKQYGGETNEMFKSLKAKVLPIDAVAPSTVLSAYSREVGFFAGKGKLHQFPDAFIFERLRQEASAENPVVLVSNDDDFHHPGLAEAHITILKSVPDLFKHLNLEVDPPAMDEFLAKEHDAIVQIVNDEVNNYGLQVGDIEDAYIHESKVKNFEIVDIISFGKVSKEDNTLVIGTMNIQADVSYTHPNWENAMYDSEDKVLIPFEDVDGEKEIEFEAEFSMSILLDDEGAPSQVDEFSFQNDKFVWVDLQDSDYDY